MYECPCDVEENELSDSAASVPPVQALVAVVGAGPAGIYATQTLAAHGAHVALLNRDLKPGGLAEYGIFPTKHKMKEGLRKQFRTILSSPQVEYFGGVSVGRSGDVQLEELFDLGFDAVLVTVGAQGTKWLGLPGEDLAGVYHAKDLVYHYNGLPPFSSRRYDIGKRVVIVGVGNVMLDIAHWTIRLLKVDEVVAVARRGPAEVKFDKAEMEFVARNLDIAALDAELERVRPVVEAVGQDLQAARAYILAGLAKASEPVSATRFRLDFLASPSRLVGEGGHVTGLEVEETELVQQGEGNIAARGTGRMRVIPADTVVFAVGDCVDADFGLPLRRGAFVVHPEPRFPIEGGSFEAASDGDGGRFEGVFLAGWARVPSTGLVGVARKDGNQGAAAVLQALATRPQRARIDFGPLRERLQRGGKSVFGKAEWQQLEAAERAEAARRGVEQFKYTTDDEIRAAIVAAST
jgi:ferredoxin--NADP+ reductase